MLAFHQALVDEPRDPLVIAAFTLALHNGGDLSEAVKIARRIRHCHDPSFSELLEPREMDADELASEVLDLLSSVKSALSLMTDENHVAQAMAKYPQAPFSDLVSFTSSTTSQASLFWFFFFHFFIFLPDP